MATFLDVTGLQYFASIFVFLFVWIVVFGMFAWMKFLGGNKFIHAMVGLLLAIFVLMSPTAVSIVATTAPFLAVVLLFAVLLDTALKMVGGSLEAFHSIKAVFLIFIIIIVIAGAAFKIRENIDLQETPTDLSNSMNMIFHPTFMGTIMIFAVAVFTIALLVSK